KQGVVNGFSSETERQLNRLLAFALSMVEEFREASRPGGGMSDERMTDRRDFLGVAALSIAAARFGLSDSARAQTKRTGATASFAPLKQIDAGLLSVGYAEAGPAGGTPVLLLHGWPYDIHSFVDVAPLLASKGYRAIVPYLRGYGSTRFLSADTFRNGQPSAV